LAHFEFISGPHLVVLSLPSLMYMQLYPTKFVTYSLFGFEFHMVIILLYNGRFL